MRLQVSIRRHALPIINIIFTTGTGPSSKTLAPNSTVTDLLQDVNDIVPLESADGEWGLEDYVVEVQGTADQEAYYECLHYQPIESLLREDDEVIIRSLGTEDLRSRRIGGRHQISVDGRHLIDGVAFGRQWLRKGGRPAVNIPPRKRRRLEIEGDDEQLDEESTTLLEQIKQLGYGDEDLDEDEDEDDDFEDEEIDEEADESSEEEEDDDEPLRIKATAEFDNADVGDDEDSEEDGDEDDELLAGAGLELSDELKTLLLEAEQLSENDTYHRLPSEATLSPCKGKRKRDEDQDSEAASDFEGFSTPAKHSEDPLSPTSSTSSGSTSEISSESGSNSDSDSDHEAGQTGTSSSGSSESVDSSSVDTSGSDSDGESSRSDSSSNSSSDEDIKLQETNLPSSSPAKQSSSEIPSIGNSSVSSSSATSQNKRVAAAPGQGLKKTQNNNLRAQKRSRLARLKADGLLPANANFADMAQLDERTKMQEIANNGIESKRFAILQQLQVDDDTMEETKSKFTGLAKNDASLVGAVSETRIDQIEEVTSEKDAANDHLEPEVNTKATSKDTDATKEKPIIEDTMDVDESIPSQEIGARAQESFICKVTPKSSEKRAKLDLASSRRMLFNSLGLRTPKTPEAEQALREKLAKDIKKTSQRKSEERFNEETQLEAPVDDVDSWKDKIVLSAEECEYEGVKLSIPPFPFRQGWDSNANMRRGASKKKGRKQAKYYDESEGYVSQYAPDVSALQDQGQEIPSEHGDLPESRKMSSEERIAEDMPRPPDFGILLNLSKTDLTTGAVIAFKELDIENFQPVVSKYRVAQVRDVQADGPSETIELMLSKRDWPADRRGSDPFAIEDEDRLPEDGLRVKKFADLIEPKLVEASSVQVNATPANVADEIVQDPASAIIPGVQNSADSEFGNIAHNSVGSTPAKSNVLTMTHVEVNTPRRNEITAIIKEAGFDSAIDKDLFQPEKEPEAEPQSSPAFHTRSHRSQRSSHSPVPASIHASTTSVTRPRFESPGLDGWDSSPTSPAQVGTTQTSKAETQSIVTYPAISQLEADVSGVTVTNDNSFQDAQQVSLPPDIDTSALRPDLDTSKLHPEYPYDDFGDATQQSGVLASEIPPSQSPPPSSQSAAQEISIKPSFLGRSLDGQASSDEESDFDSINSSLPSLRELTSSQKQKINHASRRNRLPRPAIRAEQFSISPPAPRGKRLRNGKLRSTSPDQGESDDGVELPPTGKNSQSQDRRMSQIPAGSQVVDLTFSSSPAGPESDGDYRTPRTRGSKAKRNAKAPAISSQRRRSLSFEDASDADSGSGIGKRRFLTTKKWSRV